MRPRAALLLLALLQACDGGVKVYTQVVHVRVRREQCKDEDLGNNVSCLYIKLQRQGSGQSFLDTLDIKYLNALEDLETNYLVSARPFEHVPQGTWDLRIAGFTHLCNESPDPLKAFLCGEVTNIAIPPLEDSINVFINCKSQVMTEELATRIKNCSTMLLFGDRP